MFEIGFFIGFYIMAFSAGVLYEKGWNLSEEAK